MLISNQLHYLITFVINDLALGDIYQLKGFLSLKTEKRLHMCIASG